MKGVIKFFSTALLVFSLGGCTTVGKLPDFPDIPGELKEPCQDLSLVEPDRKMSEFLEVIVDNYYKYHECRLKVEMWNSWYTSQKKIYEDIK